MLKKHAYTIAILYCMKILKQDVSIKTARNFRDLMKPYMAFASEFEKDRMAIMENKELSEEQKQEEMKTLLDEKVEIEKVSDRLLEICEEGGIKLATIDLNDLYCFENEDTNT